MATPAPFGLIPEKAGTKTISVCVNFSRSSDQIGAWRCVTKAWRGYRIHTARTWGQLARSLYSSVGSNAKLMFTILCTGRAVARVISLIYKKVKILVRRFHIARALAGRRSWARARHAGHGPSTAQQTAAARRSRTTAVACFLSTRCVTLRAYEEQSQLAAII